jgi:hypothetical protein
LPKRATGSTERPHGKSLIAFAEKRGRDDLVLRLPQLRLHSRKQLDPPSVPELLPGDRRRGHYFHTPRDRAVPRRSALRRNVPFGSKQKLLKPPVLHRCCRRLARFFAYRPGRRHRAAMRNVRLDALIRQRRGNSAGFLLCFLADYCASLPNARKRGILRDGT